MARAKPKFIPAPRIWNVYQVAARLGMSENHFACKRKQLEVNGFPFYDDLLGGWDADAIDLWLDRRSGVAESLSGGDLDREMAEWRG